MRARTLTAGLAVLVLAGAGLLVGDTASAHRRPTPVPTPTPVITDIYVDAHGTLWADFALLTNGPGAPVPVLDPGGVVLQLRHIGNGAPEGGSWDPARQLPAADNQARADVAGEPTWDLARVVLGTSASGGRTPRDGRCEP